MTRTPVEGSGCAGPNAVRTSTRPMSASTVVRPTVVSFMARLLSRIFPPGAAFGGSLATRGEHDACRWSAGTRGPIDFLGTSRLPGIAYPAVTDEKRTKKDTSVSVCMRRRAGNALNAVAEVTDGVRADPLAVDVVLLEQPRQVGALQAERLGSARLIPVGSGQGVPEELPLELRHGVVVRPVAGAVRGATLRGPRGWGGRCGRISVSVDIVTARSMTFSSSPDVARPVVMRPGDARGAGDTGFGAASSARRCISR